MAKSARQMVFEGLEIVPHALIPFVEKRLENALTEQWQLKVLERLPNLKPDSTGIINWDNQALFQAMDRFWGEAFRSVLGKEHRSIVTELNVVRNKVAHDEPFSYDDAERALDSMRRLMEAISAGDEAEQLGKARDTILRMKFAELARNEERRKSQRMDVNVETIAGILPWRDVVEPHSDVATGNFQQAEFAADLSKVHRGSASAEYSNPVDFYARTYLTDGLTNLLVNAAKRLSGKGGDPVVELQTNFGGGKTHSMLALYHMAGPTPACDLPNLDQLLKKNNLEIPQNIKCAVLVGTERSPLNPYKPKEGVEIYTTWGEIAWQLGGEKAYQMVSVDDKRGIAPGSNLLEDLFNQFSPCLILIDEWVAYLRQIYKTDNLPSGSFDANLTFVQSLTEAVKAAPRALLVASLPASQIEVGGEGGQEALSRLKQTFSRLESSWQPATQEESYEIVRRRLFQDISGDKAHHKDNTIKQFAKLYREKRDEFPQGVEEDDYKRKLEKAYPIHPELFEQLYKSWGGLEKFQRTRGVLRLMAKVIHELWMRNDSSAMIMPGNVIIGSERVEPELMHYLDPNWQSIIASDVDGTSSTPYLIDQKAPNLNKVSATRRVARAIFMATAPSAGHENRGLYDKQINLGVIQPGEKPALFGDALRRLGNEAKYLHSNNGRYWYSTDPSLNRLARERAVQLEEATIKQEFNRELNSYIRNIKDRNGFLAVMIAPVNSSEVSDAMGGVRLVVLGPEHSYAPGHSKSDALTEAKNITETRGSALREYRNTLVFLAADEKHLPGIKSAIRDMKAWQSIVYDKDRLDLKQSDEVLANSKLEEATTTVRDSIREAWCYLISPSQQKPEDAVEYRPTRLTIQNGLFFDACKRLSADEGFYNELVVTRLNRFLEQYIWNNKPHIHLKEVYEYLNRFIYLPRLRDENVLKRTISEAISGIVAGPFAYADSYDETKKTYIGLRVEREKNPIIVIDNESLLVRKEIAEAQFKTERSTVSEETKAGNKAEENVVTKITDDDTREAVFPKYYSATTFLSAERPARDFSKITEEILNLLSKEKDSNISIKLEIEAELPNGISQDLERNLMENSQTLRFVEKKIR